MNKWLELLVGLILVIVPIVLITTAWGASWWTSALTVLKGGIFWAVVGLGALFILLGISDLKG
jgi:hypothetical protein